MDKIVKNIFELSQRTSEKGLKQGDMEELKKRIAEYTMTKAKERQKLKFKN